MPEMLSPPKGKMTIKVALILLLATASISLIASSKLGLLNRDEPTEPVKIAQAQKGVSFEDFSKDFGPLSRLSKAQKEELFKELKGKLVTWTGEVDQISQTIEGALAITFKHGSGVPSQEVQVKFLPSESGQLANIFKGTKIKYSASLEQFGSDSAPHRLSDGRVIAVERPPQQRIPTH